MCFSLSLFLIIDNKKCYFCWRALTAAETTVVPLVIDAGIVCIGVGFAANGVVGNVK